MEIDVMYLEPDLERVTELKEQLGALLRQVGLSPHIRTCTDADAVMNACRAGQCDIFVCDLSLSRGVSVHFGGLAVIDSVKRHYPYVFAIGVTGGHPKLASVDLYEFTFDLFMQKTTLIRHEFAGEPNYIARLRQRYKPIPRIHVEVTDLRKPLGGDSPSTSTIEMLVRQMFRSSLPMVEGVTPERIELSTLGDGRSKSVVLRMKEIPKRGAMRRTIDAVVKISPLADHREESDRYSKFIKWSLPYDVRVDVLALAETASWGAIAYSFAHSGKKGSVKTLTDIFHDSDVANSMAIVDKIYSATNTLWRPLRNTPSSNGDIPDRYYKRHLDGESGRLYTLDSALAAITSAGLSAFLDKEALEISGQRFPNIERMLGEQNSVTGHMSMVHGDLNSNNIIVGENNGIALIDFRDAGVGHLFEDIVALEGCVRLHWGWGNFADTLSHFNECLATERALIHGSAAIDPNSGWAVIQHIRGMARQRFPTLDFSSYYYGLAYYCFRLMRLYGLPPDRVPRLLAAMIASGEEFLRMNAS